MSGEFRVTVTGRYSDVPGTLDGEVEASFHSERPEKRLAELAVLRALFHRWVNAQLEAMSR